jgi:phosphatidylglycerol:prolipoprotein diacylglycerol transferase
MFPEICKIGSFTIYSYGLMLVIAFVAGATLASMQAKKQNINSDIIFNFAFIAFVCGIIGARIFYVIENIGYYLKSPLEIIMLQHGGLSWFGGFILGTLSGILYLRSKNMPVYQALDLIVPFVALAQAIGRLGCLLNGCCYGKEFKFGLYFPVHGTTLIPTQLYSALLLLLIFIILRLLQNRPHWQGQIFYFYLLLYSVKRFFIEFWRADNAIIFLGLTLFQLLSILIFCIAFIKLFVIKNTKIK